MLCELEPGAKVTLPKNVVDALGLEEDDLFDVSVSDGCIVLSPMREVALPEGQVETLFVEIPEGMDVALRARAQEAGVSYDAFFGSVVAKQLLSDADETWDPALIDMLTVCANPR